MLGRSSTTGMHLLCKEKSEGSSPFRSTSMAMRHHQGEVLVGDTRGLGPRIEGSNPSALTMSRRGHPHTEETKQKISRTITRILADHRKTIPYEKLSKARRIEILLTEQRHRCARCRHKDVWNGSPLVFQLDHINGDSRNHLRENERMLCPNCHTQTPTYCKVRDKNRHSAHVKVTMIKYGHARRRRSMKHSPWRGSIKHDGG